MAVRPAGALVGAGAPVAQVRHGLAQVLEKVAEVARPDAVGVVQQHALAAVLAQGLGLQAPLPACPALAQVVRLVVRRQPVAIQLLLHPRAVAAGLGRRHHYRMPTGGHGWFAGAK